MPQPWASLMSLPGHLHGKRVDSRRWPTPYRGRLVIAADGTDHSVLADPLVASTLSDSGLDAADLPRWGALSMVTLVDCHQAIGACCAPWGRTTGSWFHLVLEDPVPLRRPARVSTRPGLRLLEAWEQAEVLTSV